MIFSEGMLTKNPISVLLVQLLKILLNKYIKQIFSIANHSILKLNDWQSFFY